MTSAVLAVNSRIFCSSPEEDSDVPSSGFPLSKPLADVRASAGAVSITIMIVVVKKWRLSQKNGTNGQAEGTVERRSLQELDNVAFLTTHA